MFLTQSVSVNFPADFEWPRFGTPVSISRDRISIISAPTPIVGIHMNEQESGLTDDLIRNRNAP